MDSYKHRSKSMNGPKVLTRECCEWAREESQVDEGAVQETRKVQKKNERNISNHRRSMRRGEGRLMMIETSSLMTARKNF